MSKQRSKGEGSIYKQPDGTWAAEITLDGLRRRKKGKTQQAVREWLLSQREAARDGMLIDDDKVLFGVFLDRYYKDVVVHRVQQKTAESYESLMRMHIKPALGGTRMTAITPQMLQKLYADKLRTGLSKRTVHYIHAIIHMALDQALRWGLVNRNVSDLADKPSQKRKAPSIWAVPQVNKFLAAVEDHRWYAIYVLAIYCGMREGEILGLQVEDVDLLNRTIHVRHAAQYLIGSGIIIKEPKSDAGKRNITLPGLALNVMTDYMVASKIDNGLLFTTSTGSPVNPRNLVRHFKLVSIAQDLPNIRFHDLRHTHASLMLAAGVNPKIVQERLGHSQISLTLDTYSHVMPGLQDEAADKFNDLMEGGG